MIDATIEDGDEVRSTGEHGPKKSPSLTLIEVSCKGQIASATMSWIYERNNAN
jgi:hypothetical protein